MNLERVLHYLFQENTPHFDSTQKDQSENAEVNNREYREFLVKILLGTLTEEEMERYQTERQKKEEDLAWMIYDAFLTAEDEWSQQEEEYFSRDLEYKRAYEENCQDMGDKDAEREMEPAIIDYLWHEDCQDIYSSTRDEILMKLATDYPILACEEREAIFRRVKGAVLAEVHPVRLQEYLENHFFPCDGIFDGLKQDRYLKTNVHEDVMLTEKGEEYIKKLRPNWIEEKTNL